MEGPASIAGGGRRYGVRSSGTIQRGRGAAPIEIRESLAMMLPFITVESQDTATVINTLEVASVTLGNVKTVERPAPQRVESPGALA